MSVARAATGPRERRLEDAFERLALLMMRPREGSAGRAMPPRLAAVDEDVTEESAERADMVAEAILKK